MLLFDILKSPERKAYFKRCWDLQNDEGFRKWVMNEYHGKGWIKIEHFGDLYPNKVIYFVPEYGCQVGFFAEFLFTLIRLSYASERGFVPYVEWGSDFLYYEPKGIDGEKNAFCYFFDQVTDIINPKNSSHVILSSTDHIKETQDLLGTHGYIVTNAYIDELSRMAKKYIRYNKTTLTYLEEKFANLIGNKKTLAIHYRGTDYKRHYNNHPMCVSVSQEIDMAKKLLDEKKYEQIFLATDENAAIQNFVDEFGDKVKYYTDVFRSNNGDESVAYSSDSRDKHHFKLALEVLCDEYTMTRCDGLVGGISNLTLSAKIMKKAWFDSNYDDEIIINNDIYHNEGNNFCDAVHE